MERMFKIRKLTAEWQQGGCVTDEREPAFACSVESDKNGTRIQSIEYRVGSWHIKTAEPIVRYGGAPLQPRTRYELQVCARSESGEEVAASCPFETGKLNEPWAARWITFAPYRFREKRISPRPMVFIKRFSLRGQVRRARLYASALGIYVCDLNGARVGDEYLAPGFTSYRNRIQYQTYDVTHMLAQENLLRATVSGGWAVGSYTYLRRNRIYAKRQAFIAELHIEYEDGSEDLVCTDASWNAGLSERLLAADLYDGEVVDAAKEDEPAAFASVEKLSFVPCLEASGGAPVRVLGYLQPISCKQAPGGELIYDFGQNFAGVVRFTVRGRAGQQIVLRHAEVLMGEELFTKPLRTAKQEIRYTCKEGEQTYMPAFTYMGFRYVGVRGAAEEEISLVGCVLSSDMRQTGGFTCSDARLDRLQQNVLYSARSNFVDIPTDCPQRDERLGWTGDIALFSPTAAFNFDTARFFRKWMRDVRIEQGRGGGLPMIVPSVKIYNQWEMCFPHAVDHWGDACILVPWAEYRARGDIGILRTYYPTMRKYWLACRFWAKLFSAGKGKYIWKGLHHYGDWCAPDTGFRGWMKRGRWTATACLAHSSAILAQIAALLGREQDAALYRTVAEKTAEAYRTLLVGKDMHLRREFQTGYVLPLYYGLVQGKDAAAMADRLARLVRENGIQTGFPGTPYILFALADNGKEKEAFDLLLSERCPSWLYEVKAGGTTFWERWDALREDGTCNLGEGGSMVSFNHYAAGAVGDFLYRRIAGIEAEEGGYRTFTVRPLVGGGITRARAWTETEYGQVLSDWALEGDTFRITVQVPVGSECTLILPGGEKRRLESGTHTIKTKWKEKDNDAAKSQRE